MTRQGCEHSIVWFFYLCVCGLDLMILDHLKLKEESYLIMLTIKLGAISQKVVAGSPEQNLPNKAFFICRKRCPLVDGRIQF